MSVPKRMIGFCIAMVVIAAGVALVAGGWFSSAGGRQVAEQTPAGRLPVDRSAVGQSLVDEKNASQPQPAAAAGSRDAAATDGADSEEKPSIKIPLAKLPGFGKPANLPDKSDAGNLIRSGEIAGDTGKTSGIVRGSVGKVEHLYKPAPPLEVERKKAEATVKAEEDTVKIVTGFECSTPLDIEKISPTHFRVKITTDSKLRNWFMFRVEGAKGKTVRIDIKDAPLNKWWSLNPVWSRISSLQSPRAYESTRYREEQPASKGYNGPILPDTSAQNWHYVRDVWCEPELDNGQGRFCMVRMYASDGEFIGMRTPYTPTYNQMYIEQLRENPHIQTIAIGSTSTKQALKVLRIGRSDSKKVPCVVIYAREHGSDHDSSWVVQGAINYLLQETDSAKKLRDNYTWLIVPVLDPQGAAASGYEVITQQFAYSGESGVEALAYASFFRKWVDDGNRLDLTLNLHNVESAEAPHMFCPAFDRSPAEFSLQFHDAVNRAFAAKGFSTHNTTPRIQTSSFRLGGYLTLMYGTLHMPFEVNSQEKERHLTLSELRAMGALFVEQCGSYLSGDSGLKLQTIIQQSRAKRDKRVKDFWTGKDPAKCDLQYEWVALHSLIVPKLPIDGSE